MQPPQQHSRINLAELKAQLVKKLGPERSKQYFYYLNRLLSLKLSKVEFNKLCVRIVGRENILLHNQFICSILKNACCAKVPPPTHHNDALKPTTAEDHKTRSDDYRQSGSHEVLGQAASSPGLSNGDIIPVSPRKSRSAVCDRRGEDRCSALGLNRKPNCASQQFTAPYLSDATLENGALAPIDIQRPMQHHQELTLQLEREVSGICSAKFSVKQRCADGPVSVHSEDLTNIFVREDQRYLPARSPIRAPLGVPFCPVSVGGARKPFPVSTASNCASASNRGALLDSATLRGRMEQIAIMQGLEGVSVDCANLLNKGLDVYLKGILKSCIGLVEARMVPEPANNSSKKSQTYIKLVNGVRTDNHFQMQSSGRPLEFAHEHQSTCPISLEDLRVAMELNPQQLGEDWPLLLEKICISSFEQ